MPFRTSTILEPIPLLHFLEHVISSSSSVIGITTIVIPSDKSTFIQDLIQKCTSFPTDIHVPTLQNLLSTDKIRLVFCPTRRHVLAYLSSLHFASKLIQEPEVNTTDRGQKGDKSTNGHEDEGQERGKNGNEVRNRQEKNTGGVRGRIFLVNALVTSLPTSCRYNTAGCYHDRHGRAYQHGNIDRDDDEDQDVEMDVDTDEDLRDDINRSARRSGAMRTSAQALNQLFVMATIAAQRTGRDVVFIQLSPPVIEKNHTDVVEEGSGSQPDGLGDEEMDDRRDGRGREVNGAWPRYDQGEEGRGHDTRHTAEQLQPLQESRRERQPHETVDKDILNYPEEELEQKAYDIKDIAIPHSRNVREQRYENPIQDASCHTDRIWNESIPLLNRSVKTYNLPRGLGWKGRSVELKRIVERWSRVVQKLNDVDDLLD